MQLGDRQKGKATTSKRIDLANFWLPRKKILVIDDDPDITDVFRIILEKAGYHMEVERDGNKVLKNNFSKPDLFLIDKLLSGVNGLDLCRHLKSQRSTQHIPIVMISASPGIAQHAQQAGADDYIEKPFDCNYLLKVVETNIFRKMRKHSFTGLRKNLPLS